MEDRRKTGDLVFKGPDLNERVRVFWELRSGEIADGKSWKAVISFTRDWLIPEKDDELIFRAMSEPSVTMRLVTDDGASGVCGVHDTEDMDCGAVVVSSPDLGGERIFDNPPNPPDESETKQRPWRFRGPFH